MDLKTTTLELKKVAQEVAGLPLDNAHGASSLVWDSVQAMTAATRVSGDEAWEEDKQAQEYLDQEMESLKKGGRWIPPHNALLNQALMGMNLWQFTILPTFPKRTAYRSDLNGIVIRPGWNSVDQGGSLGVKDMSGFAHINMELAQKIVAAFKRMPTVQETVRRELRWIEQNFNIKVPSSVEASLVKDSLKTAKRRWGVDMLRIKKRLIPLDGSKPRDLGAWD